MTGHRTGLIICPDERLCHLLENELDYLGLDATSVSTSQLPYSWCGIAIASLLMKGFTWQVSENARFYCLDEPPPRLRKSVIEYGSCAAPLPLQIWKELCKTS